MAPRRDWPADPVIYQIYPRSFADSTGSGVGDLAGITSRLDHAASLGVDAIWVSPFYTSPLHDGGYDVADHRAVAERHGTLDDFDALVARAHELDLRVMIDMVFNHTSTDHPLFRSALNGDQDAAACYVWRDPKPDGTAPNNWLSQFGPPAWTWSHRRRQYYLHQFLSCQPNLDLRHDRVKAMHRETIRFWRDRGVDGYRFDAVTSYLLDTSLADNPPARPVVQDRVSGPNFNPYTYQDHIHDMLPGDGAEYAQNLRNWAGPDMWMMGESTSGNQSVKLAMAFSEAGRLDACYTTDPPQTGDDAQGMSNILRELDGRWRFPWWFSCHDQPRHNTALGTGTPHSAKFFLTLLMALPGPVILYQGEELGLPQPELTQDENTDPFDQLYWPDAPGREGPRVPMPWVEGGPGYGFTDAAPWLPMRWAEGMSVAAQNDDPDSVLNHYRRAIPWRKAAGIGHPEAFAWDNSADVLSLQITARGQVWMAVFNFARDSVLPVPLRQGDDPVIAAGWNGRELAPLGAAIWPVAAPFLPDE